MAAKVSCNHRVPPARCAPSTTPSPIPPHPITTMDSPIFRWASLFTKPNPVVKVSANKAATSISVFAGIVVRRFSEITPYWLNVVTCPALTVWPFWEYFGGADSIPEPGLQCTTTLSPGFTVFTHGPVSKTLPLASCPSKWGSQRSGPLPQQFLPIVIRKSGLPQSRPKPVHSPKQESLLRPAQAGRFVRLRWQPVSSLVRQSGKGIKFEGWFCPVRDGCF